MGRSEESDEDGSEGKNNDASGDSDLIMEVKDYLDKRKKMKEKGKEKSIDEKIYDVRASMKNDSVMGNIPNSMLMSCTYDEEAYARRVVEQKKKTIFNTYDYGVSVNSIENSKDNSIQPKKQAVMENNMKKKIRPDHSIHLNNHKPNEKKYAKQVDNKNSNNVLDMSLGVFSITIKPARKEKKPSSIICPHCCNDINISCQEKLQQRTENDKSTQKLRNLTPKSPLFIQPNPEFTSKLHNKSKDSNKRAKSKLMCSELFDQLVNRTTNSKDSSKSPMRQSKLFLLPEKISKEESILKDNNNNNYNRSIINMKSRMGGIDSSLMSKSPITRTLGDDSTRQYPSRSREKIGIKVHSREKENINFGGGGVQMLKLVKMGVEDQRRDHTPPSGYSHIEGRKLKASYVDKRFR